MPACYVAEPHGGLSRARNTGIAAASGSIILFTDDDIRPPLRWIQGMCDPILAGHAEAVAGGVKLAPFLERPWMEQQHRGWLASTEILDPREPEAMIGASMGFSREVLASVPSFDEELGPGALGFWDDALFSRQAVRAGFRIAGALDNAVEHHVHPSRLSRRCCADRAVREGRSYAYVVHHWEHRAVDCALPAILMLARRLFLQRRRHSGEWGYSEGIPVWEADLLHEISFLMQFRRERRRPRNYDKQGLCKVKSAAGRSGE
jgi:GT2 family glycosyltransferase